MRRSISLLCLALGGLLLAGCGSDSALHSAARAGDGPPPPREIPKAIQGLVPDTAVALFMTTSLTDLSDQLLAWGETLENEQLSMGPEALLQPMGVPLEILDVSRPVAVAVEMQGFAPGVVLIAPAESPEAAEEAVPGHVFVTPGDDSYVSFSLGAPASPASGKSRFLLEPLPSRAIAGRIDAAEIVGFARPFIDMAVAQQAAQGGPPISTSYQDLLDSAKGIDIGLQVTDGELEMQLDLTTLDDSPLAEMALTTSDDLTKLARFVPRDYPIAYLTSTHEQLIQHWLQEMQATMTAAATSDEPWAAQMGDFTEICSSLVESIGPDQLTAGQLDGDGLELIQVITARGDAKALLQEIRQIMGHPGLREAGVHWTEVGSQKVAGKDVFHGRMALDLNTRSPLMEHHARTEDPSAEEIEEIHGAFEQVFGAEGLDMRFFVEGKAIVMVAEGDTELIEAAVAAAKGKSQATLADRMKATQGIPMMYVDVDLRAALTGFTDMVRQFADPEDVPTIPVGAPVPILSTVVVDKTTYRSRLSLNVREAMPLMTALQETVKSVD